MSFNPEKQYRCTIIRGKAKNKMDDILPAYAKILENICPCSVEEFPTRFNGELSRYLPTAIPKTLNNHRTEIAGKLFGMYYTDDEGLVQLAYRTEKLLIDNDQPAFFKDICSKFQFPNGMDKITKIRQDIAKKINIRQPAFILETLKRADKKKIVLTKDEVGYYVLNSLEVLQGRIHPDEVIAVIANRRKKGIKKKVPSGSKGTQHIRETLNYLELANLIRISGNNIFLNLREKSAVKFISSKWNMALDFDIGRYDLESGDGRKRMYFDWQLHYATSSTEKPEIFKTSVKSLTDEEHLRLEGYDIAEATDTAVLGDEGELYIYAKEKKRVKDYKPRLSNKVLHLGKTKGLGFDIQSVRADSSPQDEYTTYIEVKSTKRATAPHPTDDTWSDVVSLTRNEWIAAEQKREDYSIYRVYFTPKSVVVFVIKDPATKSDNGLISAVPEKYRIDFNRTAGAFVS